MAQTGDQAYSAAKAGAGSPQGARLATNGASGGAGRSDAKSMRICCLTKPCRSLTRPHKRLLTDKAVPAGAQLGAVKLAYDRTLGDRRTPRTPRSLAK